MSRKLPALAIIVASLATPNIVSSANFSPQQQQKVVENYSLSDVISIMKLRGGQPLYFAAHGDLVRVRYALISESILIDIIKDSTAGEELRELSTEDPLMAKLTGKFTPDLCFISRGNQYGDDLRDEYSPLNEPIQQGFKIGIEGKTQFNNYLQHIGNLLK